MWEVLSSGLMQRALIAVLLVGTMCALLGVYVVLRRMAFIGDALAHTALPGLVVAHLNGINLMIGAVVASVLTAMGIGWLSKRQAIREDTAIGILFTGMFALGIAMMNLWSNAAKDLSHMLFGNIMAISVADLWMIAGVCVFVIAVLLLYYKELEWASVDPVHAQSLGVRTHRLRYLLLVLLALTVVCGIKTVGVVLTSALLITPAATASLLTVRLPIMMLISFIVSALSGVLGLAAAYWLEVSSGAAIVLSCTGMFALAWTYHLAFTRPD